VTPEAIAKFREFLRLGHLANDDEPEQLVEALAAIVVWTYRERQNPGRHNDRVFDAVRDRAGVYMGLLLHLATVDPAFFRLACRLAAQTLVRLQDLPSIYRQMAAVLLTTDPPKQRKPRAARDALLVIAIAIGQEAGWLATEAEGPTQFGRSGCARVAELIGREGVVVEYDAIAKIWTKRKAKLIAVGFTDRDVSEFFASISPMKETRKRTI
jgi:hypothetical protein